MSSRFRPKLAEAYGGVTTESFLNRAVLSVTAGHDTGETVTAWLLGLLRSGKGTSDRIAMVKSVRLELDKVLPSGWRRGGSMAQRCSEAMKMAENATTEMLEMKNYNQCLRAVRQAQKRDRAIRFVPISSEAAKKIALRKSLNAFIIFWESVPDEIKNELAEEINSIIR